MNTYNENLQQTVVNTLSALALNQSNLDSLKTVAEYTLYYAQGAEITARDKLEATEDDIATWHNINNQSLINANQVFNLLTSATDANTDVAVSITNTATAAANVQIASNAISTLASDIGAAFNIATASLYQTDVYDKIQSANSLINEVANEAKRISKSAMNASGFTSEITISEVLAQTASVKSNIDNLFKSTQTEFDKFSKLAITENTQITKASKAERQAEGELSDARREVTAINSAYDNTNNQLNQYLSISVVSGYEITASFAALPLPTFYSPQASGVTIPPANPNYYLTLVPAQNQTMFSIDQVEQLFAQRPVDDNSQFFKVTPDVGVDAAGIVTRAPTSVPLSLDAFGNAIEVGSSYVAFLYIELSKQYKQYISNFSELLSAPSLPFTPATTLPMAQHLVINPNSTPDVEGVTWSTALFQPAPVVLSADMAAAAAAAEAESANKMAAVAAAEAAIAIDASVAAAEAMAGVVFNLNKEADAANNAKTASTQAYQSAASAAVAAKAAASDAAAATAAANRLAESKAEVATANAAVNEAERVSVAATQAEADTASKAQEADKAYQNAQEAEKDNSNPETKAALAAAKTNLDKANREAKADAAAAALATSKVEDAKTAATQAEAAVKVAQKALLDAQKRAVTSAEADAKAAKQAEADVAAAAAANAAGSKTASEAAAAASVAATASAKAAVATEKANAAAVLAAAANTAANIAAAAAAKAAAPGAPLPSESTLKAAHAIQTAKYEFRCILVEQTASPDLHLLRCPENQYLPPIYFNQAIAEQVSPANYVGACAVAGGYEIKFQSTATDNFGNLIKPNTVYQPYILTVAVGDPSDQAQYTNVLANTLSAITVCTQS